tara:strand:+ start:2501 stop:3502 length:1002 start_codon:yes stop_codon:yes gene_type:complete
MRILAVDDDPVILDLLPMIFREADLPRLNLASSGADALDILRDPETQFDCLLLDIMMSEMDGIELCERIRQMPNYRHTPILMLTAVKDHAEIEAAFVAGANDYITKPFDVKEIATRVRVAQRMTETTAHVPRLNPLDRDAAVEAGVHGFAVDDPVMLDQTERLILPFSLGNYLSQLSRTRLDSCTIFAARLEGVSNLYGTCKTHEFAAALAEVVGAITQAVDCPKLLMSYEGDGTFLCILQGIDAPQWPEIEDQIQEILDKGAAAFDTGNAIPLTLSIGNPVVPNASRNQRVKKTFDRAVGRAIMREKSKGKSLGKLPKGRTSARQRMLRSIP